MRKNILSGGLLSLLAFGTGSCEKIPPKERPYTSKLGYSTQIDPQDFGMEHKDSNLQYFGDLTLFNDSFVNRPHAFLVTKVPLLSDNLEDIFYQAATLNAKMNEIDLKPGQGFRMIGEGKPKAIKIDGMDGLSGGIQLWRYNDESDLLNEKYLDKRSIKLILASDKTYTYTFTFISGNVDDSKFAPLVRVYERFAESFKRSK